MPTRAVGPGANRRAAANWVGARGQAQPGAERRPRRGRDVLAHAGLGFAVGPKHAQAREGDVEARGAAFVTGGQLEPQQVRHAGDLGLARHGAPGQPSAEIDAQSGYAAARRLRSR